MEITKEEAGRLKESLSGITDGRRQSGHLLHKLSDVLVIGLTTVVAGWSEYSVMEDFGTAKLAFFKTFLELPNGIPDEKTFSRLFAQINPVEMAACLGHWLEREREQEAGDQYRREDDMRQRIQAERKESCSYCQCVGGGTESGAGAGSDGGEKQ